jgi:hypothetical protein
MGSVCNRSGFGSNIWFQWVQVLSKNPTCYNYGRPNPYLYPSTHQFYWDWQYLSGRISRLCCWVSLFLVAFWFPTVKCKIFTLTHCCLCLLYRLPMKSNWIETRSLPYSELECQWSVYDCSSCINTMITAMRQPHWQLWLTFSFKWISLQRLLHWQQLESWWRYLILSAQNRKCSKAHHMWKVVIWG